MRNILKILLIMLFFGGCTLSKHDNRDLDFIYETIVENHPGMYNDQDPEFKGNLEKSYDKAKKALKKTAQIDKQKGIIRAFTRSFRDNHLWVRWYSSQSSKPKRDYTTDKLEITDIDDSVTWVTLPTFGLNDEQKKQLNRIIERLPGLADKTAIVFDIRRNDGGNSFHGSRIVDALVGQEYANQQRASGNKAVYVDWRASEDNLSHVISLDGRDKKIALGLKKSLEQKKQYYREYLATEVNLRSVTKLSHLVTAKIIVIIDSSNVSAALDFIEELKMMELELLLVGKETKSDRLYMDIRTVKLPSGLGTFFFPIKVYCNRSRADKETYKPDVSCDISDTKNLQKFILKITNKTN